MMNRMLCALFSLATLASDLAAQDDPATRRSVLANALRPAVVSRLDWDLVQVNLLWQSAFKGEATADYLTSYPLLFDEKQARFRAIIIVRDKRDSSDPKPFSRMSEFERRAVLSPAITQLTGLLKPYFPELQDHPGLLFVQFMWQSLNDEAVIATYEDGALRLVSR